MARPRESKMVYMIVTTDDHRRVNQLADRQSMNEFMRSLVNQQLESKGLPPLAICSAAGERRPPWQKPKTLIPVRERSRR